MIPNSLHLKVNISKQGRRFIAYAPALDIMTVGKSDEEVRVRFNELVAIFLEELHNAGTTDEVLTELGWKKVMRQWTPPTITTKNFSVKVPTFA
jgi:uncharacterized membrane-anchored protein